MSRVLTAHLIRLYIQLLTVVFAGQSPQWMETASTWATMGVPRIICPADTSPCRSEDEKQSYRFTDISDEWFTIDPFWSILLIWILLLDMSVIEGWLTLTVV